MDILGRIYHGKVTKISRDKQPAVGQATAKRSVTSLHLSMRSPQRRSLRLSRRTAALAGPWSTSRGRFLLRDPDFNVESHIKQEDESCVTALQGRHDNNVYPWDEEQDNLDQDDQQDEMNEANGRKDQLEDEIGFEDGSNEDDDDESEWHDTDSDEHEDQDEDAAEASQPPTVDMTESPNPSLSSDEPIPSIEDDEESYRPVRNSPYLHKKTKKTSHADSNNSDGEAEYEPFGEDFEAELEGEKEDGLFVHEDDLRDYLRHKLRTPGVSRWPSEACRLYKLLYLRGLYPVMPSDWEWPLNRVHPMPAQLFMPRDSDDQALISAEKTEKALRRLFELHVRISGYRLCKRQELAATLIVKEIKTFVKWAEQDGGFSKKLDYVSPVFVIPYTNAQAAGSGQTVVEKCQSVAKEYRAEYARKGIEDYPRMIYIFVVIQHIVLVMAADTTEREVEEEPLPFAELDISNKTHWLDYSLGIAIPVMLARQSLFGHRWAFPEVEVVESVPDA